MVRKLKILTLKDLHVTLREAADCGKLVAGRLSKLCCYKSVGALHE